MKPRILADRVHGKWKKTVGWLKDIIVMPDTSRRFKSPATQLFVQHRVQANITQTSKLCIISFFVRRKHRWPVDSPYIEPVIWKGFPCYDVTLRREINLGRWQLVCRLGRGSTMELEINNKRTPNFFSRQLWNEKHDMNIGVILLVYKSVCSYLYGSILGTLINKYSVKHDVSVFILQNWSLGNQDSIWIYLGKSFYFDIWYHNKIHALHWIKLMYFYKSVKAETFTIWCLWFGIWNCEIYTIKSTLWNLQLPFLNKYEFATCFSGFPWFHVTYVWWAGYGVSVMAISRVSCQKGPICIA